MFAPLAAVLLILLAVTNEGHSRAGWRPLGLQRLGLRLWPWAILVPAIVLCLAYGIAWATGLAGLDLSARFANGTVLTVLADRLIVLVLGAAVFSLAEEIGWTAYLLPRLAPLGRTRAMFIRGVMHGVFHLPLIFLTSTYLVEGNRLIVVPIFLVTLTCAGFAYGYIWFTTESVWPASLAHSAHNTVWSLFLSLTYTTTSISAAYIVGEGGILVALGYLVVALWVVYRERRSRPESIQPQTAPVSATTITPV
jgi:membrane protease YdiL (CAAX protease family)